MALQLLACLLADLLCFDAYIYSPIAYLRSLKQLIHSSSESLLRAHNVPYGVSAFLESDKTA